MKIMKTITATELMIQFLRGKKYSCVYEEYICHLSRHSQLPRGRYFKGRVAGPVIPVMDEAWQRLNLSDAYYRLARRVSVESGERCDKVT